MWFLPFFFNEAWLWLWILSKNQKELVVRKKLKLEGLQDGGNLHVERETRGIPVKENGIKFKEGLSIFKFDWFNGDSYVQSKCTFNEKVLSSSFSFYYYYYFFLFIIYLICSFLHKNTQLSLDFFFWLPLFLKCFILLFIFSILATII